MGLFHTALLTGADRQPAVSSGVAETVAIAVQANTVVRVFVTARGSTNPAATSFAMVDSETARTWTRVGSGGDPNRLGVLFRSQGSAFTGTLIISGPADLLNMTVSVIETTGALVGNNGADAVTDIATNGGVANVSQPNLTIGGTPAAGDETFAHLMVEDGQTWSEEGGWTADDELVGSQETGHGSYHSTGQDQTFTVTGYDNSSARDWGVVGGIIKADPSVTIAVPAGSLQVTGQAPSATQQLTISTPAGALLLTGATSTVGAAGTIQVPVGSLELTGEPVGLAFGGPETGSLVLTGHAPSVASGNVIGTPSGALSLTGLTPTAMLAMSVQTPSGSLVLTGNAPSAQLFFAIPPAAGSLVLTGTTPQPLLGGGTLTIPVGALAITGTAPAAVLSLNAAPAAGTLVLTGQAPTVAVESTSAIPAGSLVLTGTTPTVTTEQGPITLTVPAGSLVLGGLAPSLFRLAASPRDFVNVPSVGRWIDV